MKFSLLSKASIFMSLLLLFIVFQPKERSTPKLEIVTNENEAISLSQPSNGQALIGFTENKGQLKDQNGLVNRVVNYQYNNGDLQVQLRKEGFSYQLIQLDTLEEKVDILTHRIDVQFINAQQATIRSEAPTAIMQNFYGGMSANDGITKVKTFRKITYEELYPNIDLTFEVQENGQMEYHFIVHEGGDPALIQLEYQGQDDLAVTNNRVQLQTRFGPMEEIIPRSWYEYQGVMKEVEVQYRPLSANRLAFHVPQGQGDLVIDPIPVLKWESLVPGTNQSFKDINKLATDASGNIYATGWIESFNGFATAGAFQTQHSAGNTSFFGLKDAFLLKMNASGVIQWATYYGGNASDYAESDYGNSVIVDNNGFIYFGGETNSQNRIATNGTHDNTYGGSTDGFIAKFNDSGVRQWGTYFGHSGNDKVLDLAADGNGGVYGVGTTTSNNANMTTSGAHQSTYGGNTDGFIVRLDDSGNRVWSTFYGGSESESINAIYAKSNGNFFIAGNTASTTGMATSGSHQTSHAGGTDGFLAKFNSSGVRQWATYYGGPETDQLKDVAIDGGGNIYLTGNSTSSTGIATSGAYQNSIAGPKDAVLIKMNSAGVRQWATYFGGPGGEEAHNLAIFSNGGIVLGGTTSSESGFLTTCSPQEELILGSDGFLAKFSSAGNFEWSTYRTGIIACGTPTCPQDPEHIRDVVVDSNDDIICAAPRYWIVKYEELNPKPEIRVRGNGVSIPNGDTSPQLADGTNMGPYTSCNPNTQTFFIDNQGSSCLALSGSPFVQLSDSTHFKISLQPPNSTIDPLNKTSFEVSFIPVDRGIHRTTVIIENNDSDEGPFTFDLIGFSEDREIEVRGNNTVIVNGDNNPSLEDDTDFGLITNCNFPSKTYTILNTGAACLQIPSITVSNGVYFGVADLETNAIEGGSSTSFRIYVKNRFIGRENATVTIDNTDPNESPFTFKIQADIDLPNLEVSQGGQVIPHEGTDDWGGVTFCETHTRSYTLTNTGAGCAYLRFPNGSSNTSPNIFFYPSTNSLSLEHPNIGKLAPGESMDLTVTFIPTDEEIHTAEIAFRYYDGSDFFLARHSVNLTVQALLEAAPEIDNCPSDQNIESGIPTPVHWVPPTAQEQSCNSFPTGSVAFVNYGVNTSGKDAFSIVFLNPVAEGTSLYITNRGWQNAGGFLPSSGTQGTLEWLADNDYPAGTVVNFRSITWLSSPHFESDRGNVIPIVAGGESVLLEETDQLFVYIGTEPTDGNASNFLAAIDWSGGWDADATSPSTSALPSVFTNGVNAISFNRPISFYDCSLSSGTGFELAEHIMNTANWSTAESVLTTSTCNFNPTSNYVASIPLSSNYEPGDIFPVGSTTVTYSGTTSNGTPVSCSFEITVNSTQPEIGVLGNGQAIPNGLTQPTTVNHTDFGAQLACSGSIERSFTIQNTGASGLHLTAPERVSLSGAGAANFTVLTQPSSPIAVGNSTSFTILFDPMTAGTHQAIVNIANDDDDQNPYTFSIVGMGQADTEPPILACFSRITSLNDEGFYTFNPQNLVDGFDNCSSSAAIAATAVAEQTTFDCSNIGDNHITITATDESGNEATCVSTITIRDNVDPVLTAPIEDITAECSVTLVPPTAIDNCDGLVTATTSSPLTYDEVGTYLIGWRFPGGSVSYPQIVTIEDVTPPVANVTHLPTITAECEASVDAPTATDNCAGSITATTNDPTSFNEQGTYIINWTYDDGNGNSSQQTQTVIITDATPPVADITSLPDVTAECQASVNAPTATDNCTGNITATTADPTSFNEPGTYTINWTYDDGNGNSSQQTQTIIITDATPPVADITSLPDVTAECEASVDAPTATDNCAGSITATTVDPTSFNEQGTYTINWSFDDGNGNSSQQTQTVIIEDATPPVADIAALPDVTTECQASVDAPAATDNCAGSITATTVDPTSFDEQGTYTINWSYDDGNGNSSQQTQTVIIADVTPPVPDITNLPDVTAECEASVNAPTATDNCTGSITATTADPTSFNEQGTYTINWTYDDGNGNSSQQTQTVIIADVTPPVPDITNLPDVTAECEASVNSPTATDNCVGSITATTADPTSFNEQGIYTINWIYADGNGNSSQQTQTVIIADVTPPVADIAALPDVTAECQASVNAPTATDNCAGSITATTADPTSFNEQGTYTINWTFDDGNGNASQQTQTVIIADVTPPVAICQNIAIDLNADGLASITATDIDGGSTDNCGIDGLSVASTSFSRSEIGDNTVTLHVTDKAGNEDQCTATVTVNPVVIAFVWDDQDGDGKQDTNEPGLADASVDLIDHASGTPLQSGVTNANGEVIFSVPDIVTNQQLKLKFTEMTDHRFSLKDQGNNDQLDSDPSRSTGLTKVFTLDTDGLTDQWDAGLWAPGTLEAFVWDDIDGDGKQDTEETGIEGVTVHLQESDGTILQTTTTMASGVASFKAVPANRPVKLQFIALANFGMTLKDQGSNDQIDSDASRSNGTTSSFQASKGSQVFSSWDMGLWSPGTVEATVWDDQDGDGKQDAGEPGLAGAQVDLLESDGNLIATTISDGDGLASFTAVPADRPVKLRFHELPNLSFTLKDQGSNDNIDSDASRSSGLTGTFQANKGQQAFTKWDAGLLSAGMVQAYVWDDLDGDGKQDEGEPAIAGARVDLLESDGTTLQTTQTDETGIAIFTGIPTDRAVKLQFFELDDHRFTLKDQGNNDQIDSDASRSSGLTTSFQASTGNQTIEQWDAGLWSPGTVEASVWDDQDGDGKQDEGEPFIKGVKVRLLESDGSALDSTFTDGSGVAAFTAVPANRPVKLQFEELDGFRLTLKDKGNNDQIDSDASRSNGMTGTFQASMGQQVFSSWDAGLWSPGEVKAYVWDDLDGDGKQDEGESAISGVEVHLLESNGDFIISTITDESGIANFINVPANRALKLQFFEPVDHRFTLKDKGSNEQIDSDASRSSGITSTFQASTGNQLHEEIDCGLWSPGEVQAFVWEDLDGDGKQDADEPGLVDAQVELLESDNTVILTTRTDENGLATILDVPADRSVRLRFSPFAGYSFTAKDQGSNDNIDSDASLSTGLTASFIATQGQQVFTKWDAGQQSVVSANSAGSSRALITNGKPASDSPLIQIFPNPFYEQTSIQFSLSEPTRVTIEIYNLLGQKAAQLIDNLLEAGLHRYQWDGTAGNGQQLEAGSYIIRLRKGEEEVTRKVQLVK